MTLTLKHYAREAVMRFDRTHAYPDTIRRSDKPTGLWVSVAGPDDWREWCTAEGFRTDALANEHDVTLTPEARILHVDNLADLVTLTYRYPAPAQEWQRGPYPDWQRIAAEYDGIIIAPYQWPARYDVDWYYSWDCASGCIWNLDAIAAVEPARAVVTS